jgi:hypothetical protein
LREKSSITSYPEHEWEIFMRIVIFALAVLLTFVAPAVQAQPSPPTTGDTVGHPPPLPGPPPMSEPSTTTPSAAASTPQAAEPTPKGYIGAYAPAGTPPTPYSTGPLPQSDQGPGLNTVASDGVTTKTVRAVPCGTAARETDGTTTCVGIPEERARRRHR